MKDFTTVAARLRAIMIAASAGFPVTRDAPGDLVVRTDHVDPKTGQPGWFGTVTVRKSYVAYHLIPLYADPALADHLSDALTRRRQGKTCFNFTHVDEELFAELSALTEKARASLGRD